MYDFSSNCRPWTTVGQLMPWNWRLVKNVLEGFNPIKTQLYIVLADLAVGTQQLVHCKSDQMPYHRIHAESISLFCYLLFQQQI